MYLGELQSRKWRNATSVSMLCFSLGKMLDSYSNKVDWSAPP